jgi:hypothetical protein
VQGSNQSIYLAFLYHYREVEIARSLAYQEDLVFLERFEGGREAMEICAHSGTDQTHRSARSDDPNPAQCLQLGSE